MRLARRALVAALTTLVLCAAVSAQTLRPADDPRNTAPTVGTGGPVGGPTGLFTIYDGQTLRRGEFTLSFAYSNYDRDPGNADIVEIPVSVQVGLSDYLELFFNTDAYRGIKVNNPQNLSSFYLPNSQLQLAGAGIAGLRSGPAIILAPTTNVPNFPRGAIFRPLGNQPFVQFPYVGGSAGTFGQIPPPRGAPFGVPGGFTATLGRPTGTEQGNFSAASNFPGIGSVFGSILPGIVLTTRVQPATATSAAITVPATFTVPPTYLADAPFINRLYGESSFNTFTIGAKIRFTGPNNPFGIGILPFYRFYADKADDLQGFNQLQRGASPGGDIGDFGAILFTDARLSRSVNLSANFGYILNSNPQSEAFGGGKFSLLDRPDELISGLGFDFPVNQHFQPILELKSVHYVGGRTPNAFESHPVDFLAGVRIYPRRFMGFSLAYRAHLNQQGDRLFKDFENPPPGFRLSDDPHGFLFQFWIGRRNERLPPELPNQPPTVTLAANPTTVRLAADCPPDQMPSADCTPTTEPVQLTASASDPDGDTLLYTWTATAGRIVGDGPNVTWDLTGVQPGTYTANVEVDDGCGCVAFTSTSVTVERCPCVPRPAPEKPPCPTITVDCPTGLVNVGQPVTFTASVTGGDPSAQLTYNWTVTAGNITSGQGTPSITVDTTGLAGGTTITGTVTVGGIDPNCPTTSASCTVTIREEIRPTRVDEYGPIRRNDEKARLDNFAIALQNAPGAQGYIIAYGGRRGREGEAQARANFARDYLVTTRGIDASRIVTVDGGFREEASTELWLVPQGATPPTASPTLQPGDVQTIRTPARRRGTRRGTTRRRGRGEEE